MSAWLVSKAHIDFLVTAARALEVWADQGLTDDYIGRMLWEECGNSIEARYGERGEVPWGEIHSYTYAVSKDVRPNDPAWLASVVKQVHCYEYQSCEHDGWKDCAARAFAYDLRAAAADAFVSMSKPYESAAWGID